MSAGLFASCDAGVTAGREDRGELVASDATAMQVQVFGTKKSADTRKALRFFAERRVRTHFVDVGERAPAPGELRRFVERFGVRALIDEQSRRFAELGLAQAVRSNDWWVQQLSEEPFLLRFPLVRWGRELTVGHDEAAWKTWVSR